MIVKLTGSLVVPGLGTIPAFVDGKPTVADLPEKEARSAINCYKAKVVDKGDKVNWKPESKKSATQKPVAKE